LQTFAFIPLSQMGSLSNGNVVFCNPNHVSFRAISMSAITSDLLFQARNKEGVFFSVPPGQEFVYKQLKEWVEVWLPVSLVGLVVTLFAIHSMIEKTVWSDQKERITTTTITAGWGKWQQRYVNTLDRLDLFLWIPLGVHWETLSQIFDSSHSFTQRPKRSVFEA